MRFFFLLFFLLHFLSFNTSKASHVDEGLVPIEGIFASLRDVSYTPLPNMEVAIMIESEPLQPKPLALQLTKDIWFLIAGYLPREDILSFRHICKYFFDLTENNTFLKNKLIELERHKGLERLEFLSEPRTADLRNYYKALRKIVAHERLLVENFPLCEQACKTLWDLRFLPGVDSGEIKRFCHLFNLSTEFNFCGYLASRYTAFLFYSPALKAMVTYGMMPVVVAASATWPLYFFITSHPLVTYYSDANIQYYVNSVVSYSSSIEPMCFSTINLAFSYILYVVANPLYISVRQLSETTYYVNRDDVNREGLPVETSVPISEFKGIYEESKNYFTDKFTFLKPKKILFLNSVKAVLGMGLILGHYYFINYFWSAYWIHTDINSGQDMMAHPIVSEPCSFYLSFSTPNINSCIENSHNRYPITYYGNTFVDISCLNCTSLFRDLWNWNCISGSSSVSEVTFVQPSIPLTISLIIPQILMILHAYWWLMGGVL